MGELVLKRGGTLQYSWREEDKEPERVVCKDVTDRAPAFMMENVHFEEGLRLDDVFSLLRKNETLRMCFERTWANEYVDASLGQGAHPGPREIAQITLDHLELSSYWEKDIRTGEIEGVGFWGLYGIGLPLDESVQHGGALLYEVGQRISYDVSATPLATLLNLPLKFNPSVVVYESDSERTESRRKGEVLLVSPPTLGQVLQGVLHEVGFLGSPEEKQRVIDRVSSDQRE